MFLERIANMSTTSIANVSPELRQRRVTHPLRPPRPRAQASLVAIRSLRPSDPFARLAPVVLRVGVPLCLAFDRFVLTTAEGYS